MGRQLPAMVLAESSTAGIKEERYFGASLWKPAAVEGPRQAFSLNLERLPSSPDAWSDPMIGSMIPAIASWTVVVWWDSRSRPEKSEGKVCRFLTGSTKTVSPESFQNYLIQQKSL